MTDPVLTYYDISPQVVAFSTTRRGGCSVGNYGEFNVNYYCGDKPSHIAANRLALCRLLQISDDRLVYPHQVHGTEVRRIGKDFLRLGDEEKAQLLEGVDAVFHLAALIAIPYSYHSPDMYVDTNIKGTLNILQAARDLKTKRILVTSTSEVYGTAKYVPIDENHPYQGQSPYSATKIGGLTDVAFTIDFINNKINITFHFIHLTLFLLL